MNYYFKGPAKYSNQQTLIGPVQCPSVKFSEGSLPRPMAIAQGILVDRLMLFFVSLGRWPIVK